MAYIVQLQEGCWIAPCYGDPGRTLKIENARKFHAKKYAVDALAAARCYREFHSAVIIDLENLKPAPPQATIRGSMGVAVGRKRNKPKFKPNTFRRRFCLRLHDLSAKHSNRDIAKALKVSPATVDKWMQGRNLPDGELFEPLAKLLGLKDYRELFPPSV